MILFKNSTVIISNVFIYRNPLFQMKGSTFLAKIPFIVIIFLNNIPYIKKDPSVPLVQAVQKQRYPRYR